MGVVKTSGDLFANVNDVLDAKSHVGRFDLVQDLFQVSAVDVVHDDEELIFLHAELGDGDDVRVLQIDGDRSFVFEHFDELGLFRKLWENAFDGDKLADAAGADTARKINFGHATHGKLLKQNVFSECLKLRKVHDFSSDSHADPLRKQPVRARDPDRSWTPPSTRN